MNAPLEKVDGPFIQTVKGPIEPSALGVTLMHEHLAIDWPWAIGDTKTRMDSLPIVNRVLHCLEHAHKAGITGFVDVGTELFGPSPMLLLAIAVQSPVHVVCSTGVFAQDMLPTPSWVYPPAGPEDIAQRFIAAATHGQSGSGIKPGVIKIAASGEGITELERNVFKAAAIAQKATGLAITTHAFMTRGAEEQVDILEEAGADLDRVVIGHFGWGSTIKDRDMHRRVARRGVRMGIDCVGAPCLSIEGNAEIAYDLIEGGHSSQIIFSHDGAGYSRGLLETFGPEWLTGDFTIVNRQLLPALRSKGVDQKTLDKVMVENPAQILAIDPKRYPGAVTTVLAYDEANPLAPYKYESKRVPEFTR